MCVVKGWLAHLVTRLHLELKPTACQCLRKVVTCNVVAFLANQATENVKMIPHVNIKNLSKSRSANSKMENGMTQKINLV